MGFRLLVGLLAVVLVGCSGDDDGSSAATVPRAVSTTISVAEVREVIDVEYVQRVMDELDQVLGDAIRAFVAANGPDKEFYDRLRAVYDEPAFTMAEDAYGREAVEGVRVVYRDQPGNPTTRVKRLVGSSENCVVAAVDRDFSAFFRGETPPDVGEGYVQLALKKQDRDGRALNPTAWTIIADGRTANEVEPANPCQ